MESIKWLGHDGFKINGKGKVIYIDPYDINCSETADFIFITHGHDDHFSEKDLKKISAEKTNIYATADCVEALDWFPGWTITVEPGGTYTAGDFIITAVPAYNTGRGDHPRDKGWVGYVIDFGDMRIYHAGDTDLISEMKGLNKLDYALLPVSGIGVMGAEEAALAAGILKPKIAIPMHYGSDAGSIKDAKKFSELYKGIVQILKKA